MALSTTILSGIQWTRTLVLILAILVVAASLSIYSSHTIPIFSLFSRNSHHYSHDEARESTILLEMIQDRRLISTLVAAQASVFCPLFLLLTSSRRQEEQEMRDSSRVALDLLCCNVLMPFGLALSWIFCILFDRKTMTAMSTQHQSVWSFLDMCLLRQDGNEWACGVVNVIHGLKYLIVLVLFLEIELVIVGSVLARYYRQSIQLDGQGADEEAKHSFMDEQQRTAILHQQV
ncbi:hypothetical protein BJV82DRAFT_628781 [Fennellomyces sp. T-0311]|nr:hypothetical protein BJV82DRAFT_628781 [Fennellomyces sp. T-0311]